MISPCKDCLERHIGCHDNCSYYIGWCEERQEVKKIRAKVLHAEAVAETGKRKSYYKKMRRKR